jgi:hypothetical protein
MAATRHVRGVTIIKLGLFGLKNGPRTRVEVSIAHIVVPVAIHTVLTSCRVLLYYLSDFQGRSNL